MREEEEHYSESEEDIPDLERDMELDDKKPSTRDTTWFKDEPEAKRQKKDEFIEIDEPETLEDLESLAAKLISN